MVNSKGINQYGEKNYPSDDKLLDAFTAYAKENSGAGLTANDQLARLEHDFGLSIGRKKLYELRAKVGAPSVRKNKKMAVLSEADQLQALVDMKESDIQGRWGVSAVKQRLANGGVLIPRDDLRMLLHDGYDDEFDKRFAGNKRRETHRTPLFSIGPWHQEHSDGHEKLAEQGLNIGEGVSLPIYASKDQFSAFVHALLVLPNVRDRIAIAHYYLDMVEERDFKISLQLTTDLGTEVDEMHKIHEALRAESAPEYTFQEYPPTRKLPSTRNTPIESFWRWQRNGEGHNIKESILEGTQAGIFSPQIQLHRNTFYWVWVPLIQRRLDEYREYWNNHKLTGNNRKQNPYGSSPKNMLINPASARITAKDCSIRVNPETVKRLRESYGGEDARKKTYQFVSEEFEAVANDAYVELGMPKITLTSAWSIFTAIIEKLSTLPEYA